MRLLIISADVPPTRSAEAAHALHLGQHLARHGLDVHILTSARGEVLPLDGVRVHPIMRTWSWAGLPRFRSFLNQCQPDAVLLMYLGAMYGHDPMMTFAATLSKRLFPTVPFVTQFEHPYYQTPPLWTRALRKGVAKWLTGEGTNYYYGTLLRDSDRVIVLSGTHGETLTAEFPDVQKKIVLIPPAPIMTMVQGEKDELRKRGRALLGVEDDEFLLVYYGYLYPAKGVETLLQALSRLNGTLRRVRLVIIGGEVQHRVDVRINDQSTEYSRGLRSLADRLGLASKIIWTGTCPPERGEGSLYLQAGDACILPFNSGVFLNNSSFSAAIAHGLPVVTTRGLSLEQPFKDGDNVLLVEPRNADELAKAIARLVEDRGLYARLRRGAEALAGEWFSWERAAERTLSTIHGTA